MKTSIVETALLAYLIESYTSNFDDQGNALEGSEYIICTNVCKWLRTNYFPNAKIIGYWMEENPTALIGEAEGGHDFLLVDDQYIIDFWYIELYDESAPLFVDIKKDTDYVQKYYGQPRTWQHH